MENLILSLREFRRSVWSKAPANIGVFRTALQTVLLAILLLCIMGVICSLTTKSLHKIVIWFAPINREWITDLFSWHGRGSVLNFSDSPCFGVYLHRFTCLNPQ